MKKLFLIAFCFLMLTNFAQAQSKPVEREESNIEKFTAKSGTLIEKRFDNVGKLKLMEVQVLTFTDLISNAKISGVRFEMQTATRYSTDTKTAFLDQDEVDGLIKSINALKTKVFNTTKDAYTEVTFRSRSGFEAGCYFSDGKWTTYVKLERFDKNSQAFMKPEDFDELLSLLQLAKQKF